MTEQNFQRWQDFSLAMAGRYPGATERRRSKLFAEVEDFFDELRSCHDPGEIGDWDGYGAHGKRELLAVRDFATVFFDEYNHSWGYNGGGENRSDRGRFYSQLLSTIRVGLDVAYRPSAGVVGFTAGDVRAIFDGSVPEWFLNLDWDTEFVDLPDDALIQL